MSTHQLHPFINFISLQVAPRYQAALRALTSVQRGDILEVVSYRAPPEPLQPIFDSLCLLFDRPQT